MALLPPPAVARPGVVELTVTAPRAAREIGVAWLDGHPDTPPVAAFKRFLLSRRGICCRTEPAPGRARVQCRSDRPNPAASGIRSPSGGGAASASATGRA